jgi:hypothetical protein
MDNIALAAKNKVPGPITQGIAAGFAETLQQNFTVNRYRLYVDNHYSPQNLRFSLSFCRITLSRNRFVVKVEALGDR